MKFRGAQLDADLAANYGNAALQQRVSGMVDKLTFDIVPPAFTGSR